MSNEKEEIDLLQQELSNILKQLQNEMDNEIEVEEKSIRKWVVVTLKLDELMDKTIIC